MSPINSSAYATSTILSRSLLCIIALITVATTVYVAAPYQTNAASNQPILLITSSSANNNNPFGPYLAEILRAEGITAFSTADLSAVTADLLATAQLVVVAEANVSPSQAALFAAFVEGGGRLIAMRPDADLAPVVGLQLRPGTLTKAYLKISGAYAEGVAFPTLTLPYAGTAANYQLQPGAVTLADLYRGRSTTASAPAITRFGKTAAWSFDLARSVAYTRQGNPANAGLERDGIETIRTFDLFYKAASGNSPAVNDIDPLRVETPHADVHMRFFARVVGDLLADTMPMPRLWYHTGGSHTTLVLTSDSHSNSPTYTPYYNTLLNAIEKYDAAITLYVTRYGIPNKPALDAWRAKGHEIGIHPYGAQSDNDIPDLTAGYQRIYNEFTPAYGTPSRTVRVHKVEWPSWSEPAKITEQFLAGTGRAALNTDFYSWGPAMRESLPDGPIHFGYINGTGLPMRFVDEQGQLIEVYQQTTSLIDTQLVVVGNPHSAELDNTEALDVTRRMIDDSVNSGYSAITTQWHVDYVTFGHLPWIKGTLAYARSLDLPIWTAERWLNFTEARFESGMQHIAWAPDTSTLSFELSVPPLSDDAQTVMLPLAYNGLRVSAVTINGSPVAFTQSQVDGRGVVFAPVPAGDHTIVATYAEAGPTIYLPLLRR